MIRPIAGREFVNPVDYDHPYDSIARFAQRLALRFDANRTRHAYYRDIRLIHQHFNCDPASLTESHLRDYFLYVKLERHWKPKTMRQTVASAKIFFVEHLGHSDWQVFSQVHAKDHDSLPAVLTRQQVRALLAGMNREHGLQSDRTHGLHDRMGECPGKTCHRWNRNNDL